MSAPRSFAVIPAAGQSRRMGRPKLLLPLQGKPVIAHVVGAFRAAGVDTVLVIVAPGAAALTEAAASAGAEVLALVAETADMRATVTQGLDWLEVHCGPKDAEPWFLAPADHPTLDAAVVRQLLAAAAAEPSRSIFLPTFAGRRGHPALLRWQHTVALRRLPPGEGLNVHLRTQAAQTLLLPVATADVLCDLDTPDDYERLLRRTTGP
jgi:molybdenum cofactor cytidylyltransferase